MGLAWQALDCPEGAVSSLGGEVWGRWSQRSPLVSDGDPQRLPLWSHQAAEPCVGLVPGAPRPRLGLRLVCGRLSVPSECPAGTSFSFLISGGKSVGFPGGARGREPSCLCRRHKTWVRCLGQEDLLEEGLATPLQCSCLENPRDRGGWAPPVHKFAQSGL